MSEIKIIFSHFDSPFSLTFGNVVLRSRIIHFENAQHQQYKNVNNLIQRNTFCHKKNCSVLYLRILCLWYLTFTSTRTLIFHKCFSVQKQSISQRLFTDFKIFLVIKSCKIYLNEVHFNGVHKISYLITLKLPKKLKTHNRMPRLFQNGKN